MSKTKRLQMDVPESTFDILTDLKSSTGASSYGEVTGRAYKLYEYIVKQVSEGKEIVIRDKESGNEKVVEFL